MTLPAVVVYGTISETLMPLVDASAANIALLKERLKEARNMQGTNVVFALVRALNLLARKFGARIVAVAEPDDERRTRFAAQYELADDAVFLGWQDLLAVPRLADAVIIATQDDDHVGPAVAAARLGYHMMLEKPMAPTEPEALEILEAVEAAGVMMAVCHVLRYTPFTDAVKGVIASGALGTIASVEHLEPIGWWHFAHSYVRGNWAVEAESAPMLLAKACHDLDWLAYVIDEPVERVSSFGSLMEFRPENRPAGATERCVDCPVAATCAYAAPTIYERFLDDESGRRWPLGVLTADPTPENLDRALREGPYGRCVYLGENDVVDHQVVQLEYKGGATASFTAAAFAQLEFRKTRIFGTRGYLEGDGRTVRVLDFLTAEETVIDTEPEGGASAADGHGGGDEGLTRAFVEALRVGDPGPLRTGPRESFESHQLVWAAERARHTGTVVSL
jgi:predicted dehydrogenase